jgi:cob(I)alamin adenosyltransferase
MGTIQNRRTEKMIDWKGFEEDRKRLKKEPRNIKNLLDFMRASASIGEVYDYIEEFEKCYQQQLEITEDALFQLGIELVQAKKETYNQVEIEDLESQIRRWTQIRYLLRDLLGITENPSVEKNKCV